MPDLAYIIRHPIQEARIALAGRKPRQKAKRRPFARASFLLNQRIANAVYRRGAHVDDYVDEYRRDLLGEDDNGHVMAPGRSADWWEPFRAWKPRHVRALMNSRRERLMNFLDLERV